MDVTKLVTTKANWNVVACGEPRLISNERMVSRVKFLDGPFLVSDLFYLALALADAGILELGTHEITLNLADMVYEFAGIFPWMHGDDMNHPAGCVFDANWLLIMEKVTGKRLRLPHVPGERAKYALTTFRSWVNYDVEEAHPIGTIGVVNYQQGLTIDHTKSDIPAFWHDAWMIPMLLSDMLKSLDVFVGVYGKDSAYAKAATLLKTRVVELSETLALASLEIISDGRIIPGSGLLWLRDEQGRMSLL